DADEDLPLPLLVHGVRLPALVMSQRLVVALQLLQRVPALHGEVDPASPDLLGLQRLDVDRLGAVVARALVERVPHAAVGIGALALLLGESRGAPVPRD